MQTTIYHWIRHKGYVDFFQCRKVLSNVAISLDIDLSKETIPLEYQIVFPLYQVGILEYCMTEKGSMLFPCNSEIKIENGFWNFNISRDIPRFYYEAEDVDNPVDSVGYFKSIPNLKDCILTWQKENNIRFSYYYRFNKHEFVQIEDGVIKDGIYKQDDYVWTNSFVNLQGCSYLIPKHKNNPEAFRIAKSYMMTTIGMNLFEYKNNTLICNYYNDLPVFIIRGLSLAAPFN